jgi:glutamine amidotransferase
MLVIVNYGLGNLGSIQNMFKKIGVDSMVSSEHNVIQNADKLVLPGVGNFGKGMQELEKSGLKEILKTKVLTEKTPILGICLGMQLMTDESEESELKGLGWIPAKTLKFDFKSIEMKVPHMGWNTVEVSNENKLIEKASEEIRYYFVHSYYVKVSDEKHSIARTKYGVTFDSVFNKDNIYGVQFHPEKSHKFGMNLLRNFSNL